MRPKWIAAKAAKLFVGDSPGRSIGGTEADILQHMAAHLHQIYIKSIRNVKKPIETLRNLHLQWLYIRLYKCLSMLRRHPDWRDPTSSNGPPRMCVTWGISAGRRSAVGSSSERSSVCQPRCSRAATSLGSLGACQSNTSVLFILAMNLGSANGLLLVAIHVSSDLKAVLKASKHPI